MKIVILGLSITSSWGNGHATTYRGLVRELGSRGHDVTFLERDVPWYAGNRDLPSPPGCTTRLYRGIGELKPISFTTCRPQPNRPYTSGGGSPSPGSAVRGDAKNSAVAALSSG